MSARRLLLDTCAILFIAEDTTVLAEAKEAINLAAMDSELFVSPISAWEIGQLAAHGRLALRTDALAYFKSFIAHTGCNLCDLDLDILVKSSFLPGQIHKDPVDRVLIETARQNDCTLVTRDRAILAYGEEGHVKILAC